MTQWTRERTSGEPKRVLRGGGTFKGDALLALMFAVKREDAVERPLGETAVGERGHSCAELGAELKTTVDQTLIRGLVTAFRVFVSGLSSV